MGSEKRDQPEAELPARRVLHWFARVLERAHACDTLQWLAMTRRREWRSSIDVAERAHTLQLLVAISEAGSLTAAGERVGLTPSAVSKALTRAEARIGVRLLQRTTRRVALTDQGESYVAQGRRVLEALEALERDASARDGGVRGTVRVSAPAVYGALKVAPRLATLQLSHPALCVQLQCDDRMLDIVAERIDVAVRIVRTPPPEFVARLIGPDRRGLYASPSYLRPFGTLRALEDLAGHAAIVYSGAATPEPLWARARVMFATNNILAAREAVRVGVGIAELPTYLADEDVATGRLCEVARGTLPATRKIFAVYPSSRYVPAPVRACVNAIVNGE